MDRKTFAMAAGAVALTVVAASSAMAVNLGILDPSSTDRVGDLQIDADPRSTTSGSVVLVETPVGTTTAPTTTAAPAPVTPAVVVTAAPSTAPPAPAPTSPPSTPPSSAVVTAAPAPPAVPRDDGATRDDDHDDDHRDDDRSGRGSRRAGRDDDD